MCGISGVYCFDPKTPVRQSLLQRMTDLIAHRGPDDFGYYVDGNIGLGHRRLSIIDLSAAGHQPMSNEDGTVWITYNGECYNYLDFPADLRSRGHQLKSTSDTETLIHLYEEYGPEFLKKIDGMYAFAIWDARRQRLLLARDRLGIKPLFYYYDHQHLIFASELKALLADPTLPSTLNETALSDFLHFMSIPDPETIFKGVKKLLPGHYLCVENGRVKEYQYWDIPSFHTNGQSDLQAVCDQFDTLFQKTVTSHLLADVPVGAFLSGGVDSSSIVAVANRQVTTPMMTFASTFRGLSEFDESPYAREVASLCQTEHHEFNLTPNLVEALPKIAWHADEPFAISSSFALYFLAQMARQHVKVVLTGDGGDEVFAGYTWRHVHFPEINNRLPLAFRPLLKEVVTIADLWNIKRSSHRAGRLVEKLRQATSSDERYVQSFICYQNYELEGLLLPEAWQSINKAWSQNITQRYYDQFQDGDQLARKLYTDIKTTLVSEMLTKVDRMTMAFGLEARVPFLDHHVVEWAFRVPGEYKIRGTEGKYLVKKTMERYLPAELLYRPKHGFNVPMKVWMRDQLREFIHDTLTEQAIKTRELFQVNAIKRLMQEHSQGTQDASNKIFVLLMLELWFQHFVDKRHLLYDSE
ncbi:MAG: asparagine synthase (glutamine-hydrolyzing) [Anaerolineales bacterium]|nr:asparagine synthase (glutamine-hydrolyzing) [Anaerolineales bacterium]